MTAGGSGSGNGRTAFIPRQAKPNRPRKMNVVGGDKAWIRARKEKEREANLASHDITVDRGKGGGDTREGRRGSVNVAH